MTRGRKAEARRVRSWQGDVAAANELDEVRDWVVWGFGAPPERAAEPVEELSGTVPGTELAETIAKQRDPEWAEEDDRWVVTIRADEDDVDAWVQDDETIRGYAPYLLLQDAADASTELMRGVLRPDRVRRRRFDAGRPN